MRHFLGVIKDYLFHYELAGGGVAAVADHDEIHTALQVFNIELCASYVVAYKVLDETASHVDDLHLGLAAEVGADSDGVVCRVRIHIDGVGWSFAHSEATSVEA